MQHVLTYSALLYDVLSSYHFYFIDSSLVFVFALLALLASAWSQEEAAPPARKSNLLGRRAVGSRALGRATTSTTTAAAPADEEILDNVDENYEESDAAVGDENGNYTNARTAPKTSQVLAAFCFSSILRNLYPSFWQIPMK